MPDDLYSKLSDPILLRRSWHLARNDSRSDFISDPFRYSDFAFRLDDHLNAISQSLANGSYHPSPLLTIDVPKSSLSVRPGTALAIEDRIVLFAIIQLIAPQLDKKLPSSVYSWRVKKNWKTGELFQDNELLQLPFLKRRTIRRRIDFVEPWYGVWPLFVRDIEYAHEKVGYKYLVVTDIVSYFENIDLSLLRDLLKHYLPKQPKIINFLVDLLDYWTWPALHRTSSPRGIPQGNAISSFLGNIYLLPLDMIFSRMAKRGDVQYFRYMDDVKVLAKDLSAARKALFLMNEQLRGLRLNVQTSKTRILQGVEIREELFDPRLDAANKVISDIQADAKKKLVINKKRHNRYIARLKVQMKKVKGRKTIISGNELRLFRRLITGFTLLQDSGIIQTVLNQLSRNPDSRLLNSAMRYIRILRPSARTIKRLTDILMQGGGLFPYQKAHLFMLMRTFHGIPKTVLQEAHRELHRKRCHWYVRQQAALLLGVRKPGDRQLMHLRDLYDNEQDAEVKRAMVPLLTQLPRNNLIQVDRGLVFSTHPKLQRIGRMVHGLLFNADEAKHHCSSLFSNYEEGLLFDRMFELEVMAKNADPNLKAQLNKKIRTAQKQVLHPILRKRLKTIQKDINAVKQPQVAASQATI
jgi:hypothetical protein